jgi:type I restriction enzyme, R subunit
MPTEADTCRKFTVPALQRAGWEDAPHAIGEQRAITDGRIVPRGKGYVRRPPKRADYLLYYRRDFIIAVVEAKKEGTYGTSAMQQAKQYAEMLGLKFAYATNGREIIEFDYFTGLETRLDRFPTPDELWQRYLQGMGLAAEPATAERLITPFFHEPRREPRYYQRLAILIVIAAILSGRTRVLLTMATGTGKTMVAFQICWMLWSAKWNAKGDPTRKPRILFLADRNFLVNDPKDKTFAPFGDARHKIESGTAVFSREIYFSTYQSLARDERRPGLYKEFPRDFFDLVIVDECHRGSAKVSSSWREILEWFSSAYQLGMTATPLREENRDSYLYFGNPVYTYSLRQGIDDGFLAPYRVHRIVTQWDAAGWRPSKDELDRFGRPIPDEEYHTADFERVVSLRARTQAIARHLTDHLKKTDRFAKTIVFCVDQEHASEMRAALNNLNADLVRDHPDYVCRVTADEGDIGKGHMERFQDVETRTPVILTTSQLLTTGLDAPTCRNVVLVRLVNSMVEFKQIIGRGTRVRDEYGKLAFDILDYTGTATRNFADPDFDGEPSFASQEEIDEAGNVIDREILTTDDTENTDDSDFEDGIDGEADDEENGTGLNDGLGQGGPVDPPPPEPRKFYFDGGQVKVVAELVYELDSNGKQLRVVQLTDYTAEKVRSLCTGPEDLRTRWADLEQRAILIEALNDRGIDFQTLALQAGKPDADPFDLLCHLAFNAPVLTRRQRADRVMREEGEFFGQFGPEAREILRKLLEKYAEDGELQFTLPDVLKVSPISSHGTVSEIVAKFGDSNRLRSTVCELQSLLYAS